MASVAALASIYLTESLLPHDRFAGTRAAMPNAAGTGFCGQESGLAIQQPIVMFLLGTAVFSYLGGPLDIAQFLAQFFSIARLVFFTGATATKSTYIADCATDGTDLSVFNSV